MADGAENGSGAGAGDAAGGGAAGGGNGGAAAGGAAGGAAGNPWYQGKVDQDLQNHLVTMGWDRLDPAEAAAKAAKSHREAAKLLGIPATSRGEFLRFQPDDEAAMSAIYEKLGVPKEDTEYNFEGLKFKDGKDLDPDFANFLRTTAKNLRMTKDGARDLAQSLMKSFEADEEADLAEQTAALAEEKKSLADDWKANFDGFMFIARTAAQNLGVKPEAIEALEKQIGYADVMRMFYKIGSGMKEASFIRGDRPNGGGLMTQVEAQAKKAELMSDKAWVTSYLSGDKAKVREMTALNTIITGGDVKR